MSISSSIGPVSGINYGQLIDGLMGLEQKPVTDLQHRITNIKSQNDAFTGLAAEVTALQVSAASFTSSAIFRAASASTSNPGVVNATAAIGTPNGAYTFNVQRLASTSQVISQGYSDSTSPLGIAGNLTFQFGKGALNSVLKLADLNGGHGVAAGSIRINDRTGASATVDLSKAVDLNDVVDTINNSTSVNVVASLKGDQLVLTDRSGGTGVFSVANVGSKTTASDLGIAASVNANELDGADVNKLSLATNLNSLNDGNGVRLDGLQPDFIIHSSGGDINVTLSGSKTLGDVISKINAAGNISNTQVVTASLSADGHGITLSDTNPAFGITVGAFTGSSSQALADLGLSSGTASAGQIVGNRINSGVNSALLSDLNGGAGIRLGTIDITDRSGAVHAGIDLSSARTVSDVLSLINQAGAGVTASLSDNGLSIQLTDTTGLTTGSITVADGATGHAATDLGLAQSAANTTLTGTNLRLRYISNNTQLTSLSSTFKPGQIRLTDSTGASFQVDLSGSAIHTIGDVIAQINHNTTHITASINATGDGILLTDSSTGGSTASVQEVGGGTTAASLSIAGNFTGSQLSGSLQHSISIAATDTLNDVVTKINTGGFGVLASIINDGSSNAPYRLSLVSRSSGAAGNLLFDGSALGINSTTLVQGQDAVVSYGAGAVAGLQATSSTNTFTNLVTGLTVNLAGTGTATVSVTQDNSQIGTTVQAFVDNYNKVINDIADKTKFDPNNASAKGVLFGDPTVQQLQQSLGTFMAKGFVGVGQIKNLAGIGVTINQDGTIAYDSSKLTSLLSSHADDVRALFTTPANDRKSPLYTINGGTSIYNPNVGGVGVVLSNLVNKFTDSSTGLIFKTTDSLTTQTTQLTARVTQLNTLLTQKKNRMITQFANLEVTIAKLQQQGSALSSFKPLTMSSNSSNSGNSG